MRLQLSVCRMAHKIESLSPRTVPFPFGTRRPKPEHTGWPTTSERKRLLQISYRPGHRLPIKVGLEVSHYLQLFDFFKVNFNIFYLACFCFAQRRPGPT